MGQSGGWVGEGAGLGGFGRGVVLQQREAQRRCNVWQAVAAAAAQAAFCKRRRQPPPRHGN